MLSLELQYLDGGRSVNTFAAIVIEMGEDKKLNAVSIAFNVGGSGVPAFHEVNLDPVKYLILRDNGVVTWEWRIL